MADQETGSAWATGLATFDGAEPIEVFFPDPVLGNSGEDGWRELEPGDERASEFAAMAGEADLTGARKAPVAVAIADLGRPPESVPDAYLRLHLLSHRLVAPRGLNVDGLLGLLPNVAWTSHGPIPAGAAGEARRRLMAAGERLEVRSVDKVPRMTDYVVPGGVRIADADRVRLGAHLAEGTTVMHEGFVNFNAGTMGPSMVEGRISAGVVVGAGTDLGGGASVMGTLSGGGSEVVTIGADCLLGANSGVGISLGDGCVVEAGLYVTAGTVVTMPDGSQAKALTLSGTAGLLFRRNSLSGVVEVLAREGNWGGLNPELHGN